MDPSHATEKQLGVRGVLIVDQPRDGFGQRSMERFWKLGLDAVHECQERPPLPIEHSCAC